MVDHDPESYRPRRAFVEPDAQPQDEPGTPTPTPSSPTPTPATPVPGVDEDEVAKPLFREEAEGADAATVRTPPPFPVPPAPVQPAPVATGSAAPTSNRLSFAPRKPPAVEEEDSTTLLPRTSGRRGVETADLVDEDDLGRRRLGQRTKLGLLIVGVAAVVAIGLAVAYAVTGVNGTPGADGAPSTSGASSAPTPTPSATALLADASMLTPAGAKVIDAKRTWTVATTVRGDSEDAPGPACLGTDPVEGAPTPQQKILRTLTANGASPPGVLHLAQAFASAEDASQAYAVTAKALGTCAITGDYLASGRVVTGAGDESTGALIMSVNGSQVTGHSVLLSRTGRVLDVVDASQPKDSPNVDDVAKALAAVITAQCRTAGGACATAVRVADGPPPAGGDEPGFLTTGDLPPASKTTAPWVATPVEAPAADFSGSQCETVSWSTLPATAKSSRVYLLQDTPGIFGLNDIVVTLKDADTAQKLVEKTRSDWATCKDRKLTATVDAPTKVTGVAAKNVAISGYTTEVAQKIGDTTTRYRVGIAASGSKVAFTFLNPVNGMDLTRDQWNGVTVRAVQRATQAA